MPRPSNEKCDYSKQLSTNLQPSFEIRRRISNNEEHWWTDGMASVGPQSSSVREPRRTHTGEFVDGQTIIGQLTGEFVDGQTIGQGEFVDGRRTDNALDSTWNCLFLNSQKVCDGVTNERDLTPVLGFGCLTVRGYYELYLSAKPSYLLSLECFRLPIA